MAIATVNWFSDEKRAWNSSRPEGPGKDPVRRLQRVVGGGYNSLAEGATVSFETEPGPKGPPRFQ